MQISATNAINEFTSVYVIQYGNLFVFFCIYSVDMNDEICSYCFILN